MTKKENLPETGEQLVEPVEQAISEGVGVVKAEVEEPSKTEEMESKTSKPKKKPYVAPEIEIVEDAGESVEKMDEVLKEEVKAEVKAEMNN